MTAAADRKAASKSHENCWVARSAGLWGSTIMTMSSVREIDAIVLAIGPRATSNWYLVARRFAAPVNIRSMLRAASSKSCDSRSRSIVCQPPPSGLNSRAEWNACEIAQAGVFEKQPKQIEMQQVGKFDGQPHRAVGRARLKSKHEPLEAVRFHRHD